MLRECTRIYFASGGFVRVSEAHMLVVDRLVEARRNGEGWAEFTDPGHEGAIVVFTDTVTHVIEEAPDGF
jgi:TolB-like protein